MAATLSALTGWLFFAALVLCLGSLATRWLLLGRLPSEPREQLAFVRSSSTRLGLAAALVLPIGMVAIFARQLAAFHDPFATWGADAHLLLFGTAWGTAWGLGMTATLLAPTGFLMGSRGARAGWWLATMAIVALGAFPAFTGHANGTDGLRPLTLAADTLHVLAAGCWAGALGIVILTERAWRRPEGGEGSLLPLLVPVFSPVALTCVTVLLATGVLASWVHLESPEDLLSTPYGRVLALKIALALLALSLGAVNWRRLTPGLTHVEGQSALRRTATYELVLTQVILLVTAVLVQTPPLGRR